MALKDKFDIHKPINVEAFINLELGKLEKQHGAETLLYPKFYNIPETYQPTLGLAMDMGYYLALKRIKERIEATKSQERENNAKV